MATTFEDDRLNAFIADKARELAAAWSVTRPYEQESIFAGMSCGEASPLIALLSAVGSFDVAEGVMNAHATGDDDIYDDHHPLFLEHQRTGV